MIKEIRTEVVGMVGVVWELTGKGHQESFWSDGNVHDLIGVWVHAFVKIHYIKSLSTKNVNLILDIRNYHCFSLNPTCYQF